MKEKIDRPKLPDTVCKMLTLGAKIEVKNSEIGNLLDYMDNGVSVAFKIEPNKLNRGWSVLSLVMENK